MQMCRFKVTHCTQLLNGIVLSGKDLFLITIHALQIPIVNSDLSEQTKSASHTLAISILLVASMSCVWPLRKWHL